VAQGPVGGLLEGPGPRTRLVVDDAERATQVLGALPGAEVRSAGGGAIEVRAPGLDSANFNETLVRAGVRVSEVSPARRTLESLYIEIMHRSQQEAAEQAGNRQSR